MDGQTNEANKQPKNMAFADTVGRIRHKHDARQQTTELTHRIARRPTRNARSGS